MSTAEACSAPTFEDDSLLFAQAVNIAHSLQDLDHGLAHRLAAADPDSAILAREDGAEFLRHALQLVLDTPSAPCPRSSRTA